MRILIAAFVLAMCLALIPGSSDAEAAITCQQADVLGDGKVDIWDLIATGGEFLKTVPPAAPKYDVNGDGRVTIMDLALIAERFGEVCS